MHKRAAFPAPVELCEIFLAEADNTIGVCVDSPVFPEMCVIAGTELETLLAYENLSCTHSLPTKTLNASALCVAISAVLGRSASFFVSHSRCILYKMVTMSIESMLFLEGNSKF